MRRALAAMMLTMSMACAASGEGGGHAAPPPAPKGTARLTVEMTGFRHDRGDALVGLYLGPAGFPDDGGRAVSRVAVAIQGGRATAVFDKAPAGHIAVAVLHDEDGDKKMKTGLFGRPKEGYGVSRDAAARFGPPEFEEAAFDLAAGESKTIRIKMRY